MPTFRSTRKGKKCFFCDEHTSVWPQGVTQHRIFTKFFRFRSDFLARISFQIFSVWYLTIIPFALVGHETGYSQLKATRLVGYLQSQYPTRAHGIIVKYHTENIWTFWNVCNVRNYNQGSFPWFHAWTFAKSWEMKRNARTIQSFVKRFNWIVLQCCVVTYKDYISKNDSKTALHRLHPDSFCMSVNHKFSKFVVLVLTVLDLYPMVSLFVPDNGHILRLRTKTYFCKHQSWVKNGKKV